MAAKVKNLMSAAHTAGIFADIAVDGPEIGTLVAIVDRAKNLPNRKTIGKQDPYCAARLGKEARKTTTDVRGGQTPKWDQELRFTVHDCPDYYQLKLSIFTDDKRTDLIGESWIDLRAIIVPGGGQNDFWQTLTCKGKYAGEIRVEITFYDTRPKPDKPAAKPKQIAPAEPDQGSVKQRTPVKRRPLPSDPVTGEAPAVSPPASAPTIAPAPAPVPAAAPAPAPSEPPAGPDHRTPPRAHAKQISHSGNFVPTQSPLQVVEYNTPPSHSSRRQTEQYSTSPHGHVPQEYTTPTRGDASRPSRRSMIAYDEPRQYDDREYSPRYAPQHEQMDPRGHYSPQQDFYERPQALLDDPRQYSPVENEHPPPPPAHRSRGNSSGQELVPRRSMETSPNKLPQMRHDVLRHEAQRQSMVPYPGRPAFRNYDSAPATNQAPSPNSNAYDGMPRHSSYDASYDPHYRSMQPTVEDVPEMSGAPAQNNPQNGSQFQRSDELCFDDNPSPAPLVLRRSPAPAPFREDYSPSHSPRGYKNPEDWQVALSPSHGRSYSRSPTDNAYYHHNGQGNYTGHPADMSLSHMQSPHNQAPPALPATLVPGLDANQSQELTNLIYEDRRQDRRQHSQSMSSMPTSTRGRPRNESFQGYNQPPPDQGYGQPPPEHAYAVQPYNRRAITYNPPEQQVVRHRGVSPDPRTSPNPHHRIKRKSVSPAPPIEDQRRKSDIPFGPDSYDALNPSLVSSKNGTSPSPDFMDEEPKKIITYDGREIDPSDHLPMETWAPEPEKKKPEPGTETRSRPQLSGVKPMPPSNRRAPRSGRHSMSAVNTSYSFGEESRAPPQAGRTRLQKRTNRVSADNSPAASSPLAPISKDNYQERAPYGNASLRGLPRAGTWDFEDENRGVYGGPPIPAKIPMPVMSGANGTGQELALMQEMQRIDIGTGRSRRRGGY
ncbi:uncharacterized protein B0J16DRAFT_261885 [Fusarium flagelliforme]|uniref:Ingression protein fic1 n=1 Tax=Fusarium flagelliforme TaxID=2675880 RepID=A0A395M5K3_9HYPO|nr:uncharacterized protein B0J16DRAFT_261885 [Fusarium flagelliforme]KAH7193066.1 hypothetical protein B0J16DRAFT_261885 [Fusarium flagelliforme]RFN43137.1 ingression protein fic1 [Fusarium flagelliforme]